MFAMSYFWEIVTCFDDLYQCNCTVGVPDALQLTFAEEPLRCLTIREPALLTLAGTKRSNMNSVIQTYECMELEVSNIL